jgi:hypothetical protein
LLIASGYMIAYQRSLGMLGFVLSALLGLYMIFTILIQDRRSKNRKGKN